MKKIAKQAYTSEFKELAVKRVRDGESITAAAKSLGLIDRTLRNWVKVRFPRYFVCHQVNFMQPFFPDFAYSANVRYIELAIGSQVLNAGEFGYKTPQCIQN